MSCVNFVFMSRSIKTIATISFNELKALFERPSNYVNVSGDYKLFSYSEKINSKNVVPWTGGLHYCTALLVRPKIVSPDLNYGFVHIETMEEKSQAENTIKPMINDLCEVNSLSPKDLMAQTYSMFYTMSTFPKLREYSDINRGLVNKALFESGISCDDCLHIDGGSLSVKTNGEVLTAEGFINKITTNVREVSAERLIDLMANYRFVKHSGFANYNVKDISLYTNNLVYCTAALLRPRNYDENSCYSLLHLNAISDFERSRDTVDDTVNKLKELNGIDNVGDLEFITCSRGFLNSFLSEMVVKNLDITRDILVQSGVLNAGHEMTESEFVVTDGHSIDGPRSTDRFLMESNVMINGRGWR